MRPEGGQLTSAEVQQQRTPGESGTNSCRQSDISLRSNLSPAAATSAHEMPATSGAYLGRGRPGRGELPGGCCCFWVEEVRRKWRAGPSHSSLVGRRSSWGTVKGAPPVTSPGRHLKLAHKLLHLLRKQAPGAEVAIALTGVINILGG